MLNTTRGILSAAHLSPLVRTQEAQPNWTSTSRTLCSLPHMRSLLRACATALCSDWFGLSASEGSLWDRPAAGSALDQL